MRASVVRNENWPLTRIKSNSGGFGNIKVISPGIVTQQVILDQLKPKEVEFRVVPDTVQEYDIMLGRPFTESLDVSYTRVGYELNFMNVDPSISEDSEPDRKYFIAEEEKVMKPDRVNFIKANSEVGVLELPITIYATEKFKIKVGQKIGNDILAIEEVHRSLKRDKPMSEMEIHTDEQVTLSQRQQLFNFFNEYLDCVARDISELGCTNNLGMEIQLKEGATPFQTKPYRMYANDCADLDKIVNEYKRAGIVSETNSEFASPAFIIRKKDRISWMVEDYRTLNQMTRPYNCPIPNFDDLIEKVHGARYFATLDLASGYLQLKMEKNSRDKTAFITETQTGEFNRAMFGLVNAPMYFAKLMHRVLGFAQRKGIAITFFDDICVFAETWDKLLVNLSEILDLLRDAKVTLNLSKCRFGMRRVEYLGYILGEGGLRPWERKIIAVENFPKPNNQHDLRRFFGLNKFF